MKRMRRRLRLAFGDTPRPSSPDPSQTDQPMPDQHMATEGASAPEPPRPLPRDYETNIPVPNSCIPQKTSLLKRSIRPTLFYDQFTCEFLGIDHVVRQLATNVGFEGFLDNHLGNSWVTTDEDYYAPEQPPLTYRSLTVEFISTFERTKVNDEVNGKPSFLLKFKMFGRTHRVTIRELNIMFGWDPEAEMVSLTGKGDDNYMAAAWWARITNGANVFSPTSSKASEILHPALRYFQRMMVFCFFSREELGRMTTADTYLLWRAADGAAFHDLEDKARRINFGHILAQRIDDIRNTPRFSGPILLGGMITWIAVKLDLKNQLRQLHPLQFTAKLSQDPLLNQSFLKLGDENSPSSYICLVRERPWCYLPCEFISQAPPGVNPWRVPIGHIEPAELSPSDITWREHQMSILQQQQFQQHQPQQQSDSDDEEESQQRPLRHYHRRNQGAGPSSVPSYPEGGNTASSSSSSSSSDMHNLSESIASLSLQMNQINHNMNLQMN